MSDQVRNPEDRFSRITALLICEQKKAITFAAKSSVSLERETTISTFCNRIIFLNLTLNGRQVCMAYYIFCIVRKIIIPFTDIMKNSTKLKIIPHET